MTHIWLDSVLGPWWRTVVDGLHTHFWLLAIPLMMWMWAMTVGGRTQGRVIREATTFVTKLGRKAYRLNGEELLTRFRPTLAKIGNEERWMPALAGLWVQRATPEGIETAVRLTPATMARIQRDVQRKATRSQPKHTNQRKSTKGKR